MSFRRIDGPNLKLGVQRLEVNGKGIAPPYPSCHVIFIFTLSHFHTLGEWTQNCAPFFLVPCPPVLQDADLQPWPPFRFILTLIQFFILNVTLNIIPKVTLNATLIQFVIFNVIHFSHSILISRHHTRPET